MRDVARVIIAAAVLAAAGAAHAAAPVVTSVYPASQRIDAGWNTIVEAHFDQSIDSTSVTPTTFRVYGRWSGPHSGTYKVAAGTITFKPDQPFFAGEWVTVSMSKGITSQGAEHLDKGYTWNFWSKTKHGSTTLSFDYRITCRVSPETWVQVYGAYGGDLNKDGWSDLTAPCEQTDDARVFLSNNGVFAGPPVKVTMTNGAIPSPNEGADFDHDGNIDLVIGNTGGTTASILFGDGTGGFPPGRKTSVACGNTVRGVGVGDFNGDGWDDFVTANRFATSAPQGTLSIVLNNGDGTFATAVTKETGYQGEYTIAIADANNDGIPDIFCGTFSSPYQMVVLLGNGNGGFTAQPGVLEGGSPWQTVVGDFNNDGNVDVASCNSNTNNFSVMFGNGSGGLSAATVIACDSFPLAIDCGDIDGDGDLEIVTSCYTAAKWDLFTNNSGVFGSKKTLSASSAGSCAVLHDRDNDGDLDITGLDEIDDWVYFYKNTGTASTVPTPSTSTALLQNHPNPFNPVTSIRFELKQASNVTLAVYDATGAFITTLTAGPYASGTHDVTWNGTDARGTRVGSGVYFYRLQSAGTTLTRKMVLLK